MGLTADSHVTKFSKKPFVEKAEYYRGAGPRREYSRVRSSRS